MNFNTDLASRGLDLHLSTSFVQKDQYVAHAAETIGSGFYASDGTVFNLYQKLKEMDAQIAELKAMLTKTKGVLQVYVIDPAGTKYLVSNNSTVDLFAGYYQDIVKALPAPKQKGAIINSVFRITVTNSEVTPLQLASSFPGGLDVGLPVSGGPYSDYNTSRRYDIVPLSLGSMIATNTYNSSKC